MPQQIVSGVMARAINNADKNPPSQGKGMKL